MTTPTVEPTVILASRLGEAQDRIAKANRRLAKAGITERFALTVGETFTYTWTDDLGFSHSERRVPVTLDYPSIGYQGWTFVATLVFEQGGTVVRNVPGQECSYRPVSKECDQCHTSRERTETFVVRNDETGEYKQVGRNCLALFFGLKPVLWVFSYNPELDDLSAGNGGGYGGSNVHTVSLTEVVAAALAVSDEGRGYRPANFDGETTKGQVLDVFFANPGNRAHPEFVAWLADMRAKAIEYAASPLTAQVIEHVRDLKGDSEYAENARVLANSEYINIKNIGIVVSFAKLWANHMQYEAERKAKADTIKLNEFVGNIKDKIVSEGTVTQVRVIEGDYGNSRLVVWLDAEGHTFKWFGTAEFIWGIHEGDTIKVQGTIKAHDEYNGHKATVLTRCKAA